MALKHIMPQYMIPPSLDNYLGKFSEDGSKILIFGKRGSQDVNALISPNLVPLL